ncbi:MAG TPA: DUF2326 domain-containing protein [Bacillus sp. (in: firmicutes)]|uniref:DUF2326 domain-containing protein n=1 Tax=Paenibacillus ehimensis TaxID=79264 RepID=UPI002CC4A21E|nr:DUF2326 domain-containing protein [Paenibacillus ehimensis]MEC0209852.1 DUF2326 domain-containing protein [Paenibacillus ehimensis]HWO74640.1 DUF2326 domain-containing protein [Bacillus sp. (in: firmicutes)]
MLYEIICEQFKQRRIEFLPNLNTVLGDDTGSNSIGKSTFLLIIDFAFGGKDYILKSSEIQRHVGSHTIKFCFMFNEKKYFFLRNTEDLETVSKCDAEYNIISNLTLAQYCDFLKDRYNINLPYISFRDIVGRYARIYGKENLNEKRPLDIVHNESAGAPINALLKLFGLYNVISELEFSLKQRETELSAFKNAQKYNFVSSIGKRKYSANLKELAELEEEKEKISKDLDNKLLDIDSVKAEELIKLKQRLSIVKRQRSRYYSQLLIIENNIKENSTIKSEQFDDLLKFFPDANIRSIAEVEKFHHEIRNVLRVELKEKKEDLNRLISVSQNEIDVIESNIKQIIQIPNLSKAILAKYSGLQKKSETLESENNAYLKLISLTTSRDDTKIRRDQMKKEQLQQLQMDINTRMQEINDYIYSEKKKPPIITFDKNQYNFETIDDTGTGTSYKNMVVYDLSILELTALPILIHDSVVLKQIADEAIEKILKKYKHVDKQIFISFDKKTAYTAESQKILMETKVLELSPNGNELFGRSWNNK